MQLSEIAQNAAVKAVAELLNYGVMHIYADNGQLLAQVELPKDAFTVPQMGVTTLGNPIKDVVILTNGKAQQFDITSGGDIILTGTIGPSDTDMIMGNVDLKKDDILDIYEISIIVPIE